MSKRSAIWFTALLVLLLLVNGAVWFLRPPNRTVGKVTFGVGSPGSSWSREVSYAVDGPGEIASKQTTATVTFSEGSLIVEKARVLFNGQEIAKLAEDAKVVEVDYTTGILTISADGTKVHDAKLRK